MKRYYGYVRVSVQGERSGDSFISPEEQARKIKGWAQMKGDIEVVFPDHPDINVSGGAKSRPALDFILDKLERREADGIVVSNLDRLSRLGVSDALELIATIKGFGADIAIIEPSIDTADPVTGEFVLTLFLALNRMERQRAKVRWAEAAENAVRRKMHTAASPYGYMRPNEYDKSGVWIRKRDDRDNQTETEPRRLIPHPKEAPMVKELFAARAAGEGWGSLTRRFNERGFRTRRGHAWTAGRLKQLVESRTYMGVAHYADFEEKDAHEALVDPVTWEAAQSRRGPRLGDSGGVLRGIARCANCRFTLQYDNGKSQRDQRDGRNARYRCVRGTSHHGNVCDMPTMVVAVDSASGINMIPIPGLESVVTEAVLAKLEEQELVFQAVGDTHALEQIDAEIARLETDLNDYVSDTELRDVVSRDAYLLGAKERQEALDDANTRRREALKDAYEPLNGKSVARLREEWDEMDVASRRNIIDSVVQAVFVRKRDADRDGWFGSGGRFHIVWRDEPEIDIPRQGRRDWVPTPFVFPDDTDPVHVGVPAL